MFDDIQPLIQENDDIDPGYIGKPWGGHPQKSTTIDQTWYFCFGLHRYCEMADPGRKKRAEEMILGNVDWWIKRGYRHFGHRDDVPPCWLSPSHGGGAMAEIYLGYVHTKDKKYLDECERLNGEYKTDWFPCRRSPQWCPVDDRGRKTRRMALWHHALALALWLLVKEWPERKPWWQERMVDQWFKEFRLGVREDGMVNHCVRVNLLDETEDPIGLDETGLFGSPEKIEKMKSVNLLNHLWISAERSGYFSAHIAWSASLVAEAVPWIRESTAPVLRHTLEKIDLPQMLWTTDPDGKQVPPERVHMKDSLPSKAITAWLAAYWSGRRLGIL